MIRFYLAFSVLLNLFLIVVVFWVWDEKEYWAKKFQDAIAELYPIEWDFKRDDFEKGWDDET